MQRVKHKYWGDFYCHNAGTAVLSEPKNKRQGVLLFLLSAFFIVCQTSKIIKRYTIEIRKCNGVMERDLPVSALIERILLGRYI